ncbi:uncharacterized protein LOC113353529 isoform X2 [Papaver somniferum]|uniref:uncharacterized protein LOC113353529 isoform X2 n=1 Tax=Papaver somniferum TaxID=3469 RepID=UPI000E6FAAB0|nr:uncharacterized protein LOC113353529 isoform X2 [Papaver somniferum]
MVLTCIAQWEMDFVQGGDPPAPCNDCGASDVASHDAWASVLGLGGAFTVLVLLAAFGVYRFRHMHALEKTPSNTWSTSAVVSSTSVSPIRSAADSGCLLIHHHLPQLQMISNHQFLYYL